MTVPDGIYGDILFGDDGIPCKINDGFPDEMDERFHGIDVNIPDEIGSRIDGGSDEKSNDKKRWKK